MTLEEEVTALSAKVTALIMLVETLFVDDLSKDDNAAAIGDAMVKSMLNTEALARAKVGESEYTLQITETVTSLIDRAVRRAQLFRQKKSQQ